MLRISSLVALLGVLFPAAAVFAQNQVVVPSQPGIVAAPPAPEGAALQRNLELSAGAQSLTGGFGNWRDLTLRGTYGLPSHVLQGEISQNHRFGQDGTFVGISDTYTFNPDWYGSVALGVGDGAFYLPNYRVDATLYRKFLPGRNLVGSVGVGYYDAPTGYTDRSVSLGAVYYFEAPWIVEGGVRFNTSNPGSVKSQQQFLALTWGRNKQDLVTARYGWGSEGYLAVAAGAQLVNFNSREASLSWRHWLNPSTGVVVGANRYTNPSYRRSGVSVGIFHDF
ncbi:MAG: YaiO family outer membrane beta-barrel protein [Haliea sp.]|nr:MAG: YaiO family outer membrane beta-barrel protein [Haliea sp.]